MPNNLRSMGNTPFSVGKSRSVSGSTERSLPESSFSILRVIDGSDSTLETMEKVPVNPKNRPLHEIKLESVRTQSI